MKNWMTFAFTWGTIALLFTDPVKAEPEMDGVCSVLNSLTPEGKALSRFNAMVFGDFIAGKNANIMGQLAVKGTLTGENALINSKKTSSCELSEDTLEHHGLILGGDNASPITVHGYAYTPNNNDDTIITTPLEACASPNEVEFDFDKVNQSAMEMSRKLAGMLPNWSIDADGVIVNMLSEGVNADQPFNLFAMPACTMGACKAVNYFDCGEGEDCEAPVHMLSSVDTMFLGKGEWAGPVEEPYPNSEMVVFNIPVLDQHTFDIQSKDPSIGLNACNTIYNFYAVDEEGKFKPEGRFTIKRSTTEPLAGMVLAPQAHILDDVKGSFSGQVIAASYEALGDNVSIKDYISSGDSIQCQAFQGCLTSANSLPQEEKKEDIAEEEVNSLEGESLKKDETKEDDVPEEDISDNELLKENEEPWNNVAQNADDDNADDKADENADASVIADDADASVIADDADASVIADDADASVVADDADASVVADDVDTSGTADEDDGSTNGDDEGADDEGADDEGADDEGADDEGADDEDTDDEDRSADEGDDENDDASEDDTAEDTPENDPVESADASADDLPDSEDTEESSVEEAEPEESSDDRSHYRWNRHRNGRKGHGHGNWDGNWDGHWDDEN